MDFLDFDDVVEACDTAREEICEETLPLWCKKAEEGDADAQYAVALYLSQQNAEQYSKDIQNYLKLAAAQGHESANMLLVEQNLAYNPWASVSYLSDAAEKGSVEAMWKLGACLSAGLGTNADPERAQYWYEKAAEQGDSMQKVYLAIRYMQGNGVPQSMVKAMSLVHQATMSGIPNARELLMQGRLDSAMEAWDALVRKEIDDRTPLSPEPEELEELEGPEPVQKETVAEAPYETVFDMELTKRVQSQAKHRATIWGIFGFVLLAAEILLLNKNSIVWYLLVLFDAFAYLPIGCFLLDGFGEPRLFALRNKVSYYTISFFSFLTFFRGFVFSALLMAGRFVISPIVCRKIQSTQDDLSTVEGLKNFYKKHKGK